MVEWTQWQADGITYSGPVADYIWVEIMMLDGEILQVRERAVFDGDIINQYGDRQLMHGKTGTKWRDATIEDLTSGAPPRDESDTKED